MVVSRQENMKLTAQHVIDSQPHDGRFLNMKEYRINGKLFAITEEGSEDQKASLIWMIMDRLWKMDPEELNGYIPPIANMDSNKIRTMQSLGQKCNEELVSLINESNKNNLLFNKTIQHGKGHYLALFDGKERVEGNLRVYRIT
jgi:hypothetical protein